MKAHWAQTRFRAPTRTAACPPSQVQALRPRREQRGCPRQAGRAAGGTCVRGWRCSEEPLRPRASSLRAPGFLVQVRAPGPLAKPLGCQEGSAGPTSRHELAEPFSWTQRPRPELSRVRVKLPAPPGPVAAFVRPPSRLQPTWHPRWSSEPPDQHPGEASPPPKAGLCRCPWGLGLARCSRQGEAWSAVPTAALHGHHSRGHSVLPGATASHSAEGHACPLHPEAGQSSRSGVGLGVPLSRFPALGPHPTGFKRIVLGTGDAGI